MIRSISTYLCICVLALPGIAGTDKLTSGASAEQRSEPTGGGSGLKIYADQIGTPPFARVSYGYDRDALCTRGRCDDNVTICLSNANCNGIGSGSCNYTPCTNDFDLCDDGVTICGSNADCSGIGSGLCNSNPCSPPNEICGVKVESLTPGAPTEQTIWGLVCDPATPPAGTDCQVGAALPSTTVSWDFSGFNLTNYPDLKRAATTFTPINSTETTNEGGCGFNPGGAFPQRVLGREDKNYADTQNFVPTLTSLERENGVQVCDNGKLCTGPADCSGIGSGNCTDTATIWVRGISRFEGIDSDTLGAGESHLCHDGGGRTAVPLWRFPNQDSNGYFMEFGDPRWEHLPFGCEPVIVAPTSANVEARSGFEGKQAAQVVNEGLVALPSGHKFRSLVVRSRAEYGVSVLGCLIDVDAVRTVLYLWTVPHVGTVVRLQSDKIATNLTDVRHLSEIDVKHGLFPPLTLGVGTVTSGSVDLSWDPGLITDHISGYRIYWDTESGGECSTGLEDCTADHPGVGNCAAGESCCATPGDVCTSYQFDSLTNSGQVTFNTATSATVSGLDPNTTYFFTLTSMSDFTDPKSLVTTSYESVLYPTQLPAVPVDLPIEVSASTSGAGGTAGAVPDGDLRPGTQLTVDKSGGGLLSLAWGPSCQGGDTDYGVYEGLLGSFASHLPVTCSTAGATSSTLSPGAGSRYYLVVPSNGSAEGSYGLDSQPLERPASTAACEPQSFGCP